MASVTELLIALLFQSVDQGEIRLSDVPRPIDFRVVRRDNADFDRLRIDERALEFVINEARDGVRAVPVVPVEIEYPRCSLLSS
jgi:hypothetical protein